MQSRWFVELQADAVSQLVIEIFAIAGFVNHLARERVEIGAAHARLHRGNNCIHRLLHCIENVFGFRIWRADEERTGQVVKIAICHRIQFHEHRLAPRQPLVRRDTEWTPGIDRVHSRHDKAVPARPRHIFVSDTPTVDAPLDRPGDFRFAHARGNQLPRGVITHRGDLVRDSNLINFLLRFHEPRFLDCICRVHEPRLRQRFFERVDSHFRDDARFGRDVITRDQFKAAFIADGRFAIAPFRPYIAQKGLRLRGRIGDGLHVDESKCPPVFYPPRFRII